MRLDAPRVADLELAGRRVLVRVDFNVPFSDGEIRDDTRIKAAIPTLRLLLEGGARPVLLTHLGRPGGRVVEDLRVDPIAKRLQALLGSPVVKCDESVGANAARLIVEAEEGACVLLENVRFHPGETEGDTGLAAAFSALGDCFVGDAFGAVHRDHSSVSGVARLLPSAAGLLLESELSAFARVLEDPARPMVAIIGGAKVSDKLSVIENLLEKVDTLVIGGGMAYTFLAGRGVGVGGSLLEEDKLDLVRACEVRAAELGTSLLLPVDHVVASKFSAGASPELVSSEAVPEGKIAMDIGPKTRALFGDAIQSAKTVVWNGPMGVFEWDSFSEGTKGVGEAVATCGGYTVVGGGDSVAALAKLGLKEAVSHVSTGGGASLELLEGRELPGVVSLS